MAEGEFEGVNSDVSRISDITDESISEDGSNVMGDPSLPSSSSIADISDDGIDSGQGSDDEF